MNRLIYSNGKLYGVRCALINSTNFKITDKMSKENETSQTTAQCAIQNVNPSNLTIKVLNIDLQDCAFDKKLQQLNITQHTIINCQNLDDDITLIYYWG